MFSTPFTGYEMFINFGQITCTLDDGTSDYLEIDSPTTLNDGLSHSAFCVIDRGGNRLNMYIDGVAVTGIVANGTNDLSQLGSLTNSTDFHTGRFSGWECSLLTAPSTTSHLQPRAHRRRSAAALQYRHGPNAAHSNVGVSNGLVAGP